MKYLITKRRYAYNAIQKEVGFEYCGFGQLKKAINSVDICQFDTETTYVDTKKDKTLTGRQHFIRDLLTLQFGVNNDQYLVDYYGFSAKEDEALRLLFDTETCFLGHNMAFDYTVVRAKLGVEIRNMHDTFLMSKVLNMGTEFAPGYHSLAGCLDRFFGIVLPKDEQKSFDGNEMTANQLNYAFNDVVYLHKLYGELKYLMGKRGVYKIYDEVERRVIAPLCDMSLNRMRFDKKHWSSVGKHLQVERDALTIKMNNEVLSDEGLVEYLKDDFDGECLITPEDEYHFKWSSAKFKKLAYGLLVPNVDYIQISTLKKVGDYLKSEWCTKKEHVILQKVLDKDFDALNDKLIKHHNKTLIDEGIVIPADTIKINWNSPKQKLRIFNYYYPELNNTNAKTLARLSNPLISVYRKFSKVNKSCSTYGENFVKNYVYEDTIAPSGLVQVLNTGRMAYGVLLQLPGKDIFRNAFLPPFEDWVFVDSDYSSAEIAFMAYASQEEGLLQAIRDGRDLHSYSASIVFGQEWLDAAEDGCIWMKTGHTCKCPKHKEMRKKSKAITFGLCYGLTHMGLADRLDISKTEAKDLIAKYFEGFPKLKVFLDNAESSGMNNLEFTCLGPYYRKAFFAQPSNKAELSGIGRKCKNLTFQEGNATILKIALIKIHALIKTLPYEVKLHIPVHDQILSSCHRKHAKEWAQLQAKCMVEAGEVLLGKGLLGVDTDVWEMWSKDPENSIIDKL